MIYVYAMVSLKFNRIYIGQTDNLEKRLNEHNLGATRSTKFFKPWRLFYSDKCLNRKNAREKEKFLKSGCGREFLKTIAPVAQLDRAGAS